MRAMRSPRYLALLVFLLGSCLGKPPEATRLATSPSFSLPRGAASFLPRKQQRARLVSSRSVLATTVRACSRRREAATLPTEPIALPRRFRPIAQARLTPRAEMEGMTHPLRC